MLMHDKQYQQLNWNKNHGLIPSIIQHATSGEVLMLGYMNELSFNKTIQTGYVTFFSRSKNRLWMKGESSGNTLQFIKWYPDCDNDSLLILALPHGFTCHNNTSSCFSPAITDFSFLYQLENIISNKKNTSLYPSNIDSHSYTSKLYISGTKRIAQKVGEEGVETALAAIAYDDNELIQETSDLIYHILVLLQSKSLQFSNILQELRNRSNAKQNSR